MKKWLVPLLLILICLGLSVFISTAYAQDCKDDKGNPIPCPPTKEEPPTKEYPTKEQPTADSGNSKKQASTPLPTLTFTPTLTPSSTFTPTFTRAPVSTSTPTLTPAPGLP